VTDAMVSRWADKTPHLDVLSHSAGIVDVSRRTEACGEHPAVLDLRRRHA
jgi:hypothetical protein